MASTNQQLASLVANLTANTAGNITAANIANYTGNLYTFISNNGTSVKSVGIQSSTNANFTANYTLTLPVTAGANGQALTTDGSGILAWSSAVANGNSNINIPASNGNVNISAVGNANIVQVTGANVILANAIPLTLQANNGTAVRAISLKASTNANFTANYSLTLPVADGTAGQVLSTDGSGSLSFASVVKGGNSNVTITANANITMAVTSTNAFTLATNLVSIGSNAGAANAGANSVYIGRSAALDGGSYANTVVINGGSTTLNPAIAGATYLAPVRFDSSSTNVANNQIITYDTNTKELRYGSPVFGYALENLTIVGTAPPSTTNLDVLSNAITYYTSNATANVTINIRGNGTTALNSILATGQSVGVSLVFTNGSGNSYYGNVVQIDGTVQSVRYASPSSPANTATTLTHTYTIIKTGSSAYTVLGAITNYV